MKGEARAIYQMFDGSKTKLQIPVYQRNYDWKVPNCQQLFDDLVDMVKEDRDTHFFGRTAKKRAFSFALIWLNVHPGIIISVMQSKSSWMSVHPRAGIIRVPWRWNPTLQVSFLPQKKLQILRHAKKESHISDKIALRGGF